MRVSDTGLNQLILGGLQRAQTNASQTLNQAASGTVADGYGGLDGRSTRLLSAEGLTTRSIAYEQSSKIAQGRFQAQGNGLEDIASAVRDLQENLIAVLSNGVGNTVDIDVASTARRVLAAINAQQGGEFVFGGDNALAKPVDASNLDELLSLPANPFARASSTLAVLGENEVVSSGYTAEEIGAAVLAELASFASAANAAGGFQQSLSPQAQELFIQTIDNLENIASTLDDQRGQIGVLEARAERAAQRNSFDRSYSEIVAAQIEEIDLAAVISQLNQDQLAIDASAQALSVAGQLSLLDFI